VLLSREGLEGKLGKGRAVGVGRCGGAATLLAHLGTESGAVPSHNLCSHAVGEGHWNSKQLYIEREEEEG